MVSRRSTYLFLVISFLVVYKNTLCSLNSQSFSLVPSTDTDIWTLQSEVADSNERRPWSDLKVAIYMTTHLSAEHLKFLNECWPSAIEKLPLLRDAHLIMYTSANITEDLLKKLPFQSITVKTYNETRYAESRRKQDGAIRAMLDPFKYNWFSNYDWVIRLNPDVLIRRDEWLRMTMLNETVDAILIEYIKGRAIHTDFTAFRPSAPRKDKLYESRITTAEYQIYGGFEHIIQSGRLQWLPHAERTGGAARVVGKQSDVIHHHELVNYCPDFFNVTQEEF